MSLKPEIGEHIMTTSIIPTIAPLSVQNGTDIITANVAAYVRRYRTFAKKTAEAIIELSATLIEAEDQLSDVDFAVFCKEVGVEKSGSTYKKLRKIGELANRFRPFTESLPNSWTTIYKLSRLPSVKFDRLTASGTLSPFMTAREIDEQTGDIKTRSERVVPDVTISLQDLDPVAKAQVHEELSKLANRLHFQWKADDRLVNELANLKMAQAN